MAVPKRRHSRTRQRKRRTHWKAKPRTTTKCAKCGAAKLSHRVCPECGYYRDQELVVASS
jgi:large subunit ribosomal protein L32